MALERAAKRAEDYEVGDGRRQARLRAALGAVLIAALFGALTLVDRPDESGAPALPGAASGAGEAAAVVPPREPVVAAAVSVPPRDPAPVAEVPAQGGPEAASAVRDPDQPPAGARAADAPGERNGQGLEPKADPGTADSPVAAEAAAGIPPGQGVLVQLGVFTSAANAQRLYEELQHRGVPAHLETRVVAGPFPDRRSAEQARAELARSGLAKGLIVRPN